MGHDGEILTGPHHPRKKVAIVVMNTNPMQVTFSEQLGRVHSAKLIYFKMINNDDPGKGTLPGFLFLRVDNIGSQPDLIYNVGNFTGALAIEASPIHFRPDPPVLAADAYIGQQSNISGYQHNGIEWMASDFNSFRNTQMSILGEEQTVWTFTGTMKALLVFEVSYEGVPTIPVQYANRFRS